MGVLLDLDAREWGEKGQLIIITDDFEMFLLTMFSLL
jgi:hypothetical protein